jgi:hypothetical protein
MLPLGIIASLLLVSCLAYADVNPIVNPNFGTGDFTGWTLGATAGYSGSVVTGWIGETLPYSPPAGSDFAVLGGISPEFGALVNVQQEATLQTGDVLSGWAALDEHPGGEAAAEVTILQYTLGGDEVGAYALYSANDTGSETSQPWTSWTYDVTAPGEYVVETQMTTADTATTDYFLFTMDPTSDDDASAPEPGSRALLLTALLPLGALLRRKRHA